MSLFQVVILAIVQGLTEFLPISSSAHLALAPWLLGWPDQGLTFDIALHVGTLVAVLGYFLKTWIQVLAQGFGLKWGSDRDLEQNRFLLWYLVVGSIPVGVAGFLLKDYAENWRNPYLIGSMLIGVGVLMYFADRAATLARGLDSVRVGDALAVGLWQALAIVPGTSRSGITIVGGLFRGLDRTSAARFSFLLSTPAIGGAALKALLDLRKTGGIQPAMLPHFVIGVVLSGITGGLVIGLFLRYLRKNSLRFFVLYRIVFGIIVIALAIARSFNG